MLSFYTARGWALLPIKPRSKEPLTAHGVKDATTDTAAIARWVDRWPDANWAVACGAPGPQVLDVDRPEAVPAVLIPKLRVAPAAASARGGAIYFAGTEQPTVVLDFGELRGRGSYQLVPPSTHPNGTPYVWVRGLRGPLPPVPKLIVGAGKRAGCGEHVVPPTPILAGEGRWPYLRDFVVRLLRAGIVDRDRLLAHVRIEFEIACESLPPPERGKLESLVDWALQTRIADRERGCVELADFIRRRRQERAR
jgi:hypothetical protein